MKNIKNRSLRLVVTRRVLKEPAKLLEYICTEKLFIIAKKDMTKKFLVFILIMISSYSLIAQQFNVDTIKAKKEELLINNGWLMDEIVQLENNNLIRYLTGANFNTNDFSNDKLVFNADKTGTYYINKSSKYPISWNWMNEEGTQLSITIKFSSTALLTINCANVDINESFFFATATFTNNGHPVLAWFKRKLVQK